MEDAISDPKDSPSSPDSLSESDISEADSEPGSHEPDDDDLPYLAEKTYNVLPNVDFRWV